MSHIVNHKLHILCIMHERKYVPYFLFFMVGYVAYNVVSTLEYLRKGQVII